MKDELRRVELELRELEAQVDSAYAECDQTRKQQTELHKQADSASGALRETLREQAMAVGRTWEQQMSAMAELQEKKIGVRAKELELLRQLPGGARLLPCCLWLARRRCAGLSAWRRLLLCCRSCASLVSAAAQLSGACLLRISRGHT